MPGALCRGMPAGASEEESSFVLELLRPLLAPIVGPENVTLHLVRKLAHFTEFFCLGCVLALLLSFFYWNGFRQSVRSVRRSVWDGAVEWKASIYCIVCLCIGALTKLSSLTSHSVGKSLLKAGIDSIASVMRYTQETHAYADVVRDGLYTICGIGNSSLTDVSTVCSAAAVVCAVVILIQMRIRNGAVRSAVG